MTTLEISGASIVAVGSFNPPLLSLDWFVANKLIGEGDAAAARARSDYVVTRQISRFQTDFAVVQAVETQLSIGSAGPVTPALADLAISVFELLPHTPVTAIGLNFIAHYKVAEANTYHRFGDALAPKDIWNVIFPGKACGLANLTILVQDGARDETPGPNNKHVTIQPSSKVKPGIYFDINNHFTAASDGTLLKHASGAASVVKENWRACHDQSHVTFDKVLSMATSDSLTVKQ
jgi:hypothetical protein